VYNTNIEAGSGPAQVQINTDLGSPLSQLLLGSPIIPGSAPSYQLCKTIYSYHPLGAVLTEAPLFRAQSKPRIIDLPGILGAEILVEQFNYVFDNLSSIGAQTIIHNHGRTSRIYGISTLAIGEQGKDMSQPLDLESLVDSEVFFNVFDPLNTSGSLVLDQDPNSPGFLKPIGPIVVGGKAWHPSRVHVKMNEAPLYIEWTGSAFGFVGRSIYQRALYPLKTFLQSMITDQMVTQKAGLLVANMEQPGSFIDSVMGRMFGAKRSKLKEGVTGQVLSIGLEEKIETLNMQNVDTAMIVARTNILKNIASAAGMPASIIAQETLTAGFGEGTEDAKKEVEYLEYIRKDLQPAYDFIDNVVMRKAWTPGFYKTLQRQYKDYRNKSFDLAFYEWSHAFKAMWPNLIVESEAEKSKTEDVKMKAVIAVAEAIAPLCDPVTKAKIVEWAADNCNSCDNLFSSKIDVDIIGLEAYLEENQAMQQQQATQANQPEGEPRPFSEGS
jgi:hypothetical protein